MEGGGETHDGQSVEQVAADQGSDADVVVSAQPRQDNGHQFRQRRADGDHQGADHVGIDSQRSGNTRGTHHEQATGSH
jgi:hypothetical protein